MNAFSAVAEPRHPTARTRAARAVGAAILGIASRMIAAQRRAQTLRVLGNLDDAALKDIGLTRGQIDAVERDPRYIAKFPGF